MYLNFTGTRVRVRVPVFSVNNVIVNKWYTGYNMNKDKEYEFYLIFTIYISSLIQSACGTEGVFTFNRTVHNFKIVNLFLFQSSVDHSFFNCWRH
jgi:hypothetical protein